MSESRVSVTYANLPVHLIVKDGKLVRVEVGTGHSILLAREFVVFEWTAWFDQVVNQNTAVNPDRLDWNGLSTVYQQILWELRRTVTVGSTISYGALAKNVGKPKAARLVGRAMALNPFPLLFPCHRVVQKNGKIGEYSAGGTTVKKQLLDFEGAASI